MRFPSSGFPVRRILLGAFALVCALCLALGQGAEAGERVMEVQGVRVEIPGAGGREAAMAKATEQAAVQVLQKLGSTRSLPKLSPAQLQSLTTYVDVANESAQPNYYAGTFNVGLRVAPLLRFVGGGTGVAGADPDPSASVRTSAGDSLPARQEGGGQTTSAEGTRVAPRWVLVVPVREVDGRLTLWETGDPWAARWSRGGQSGSLTFAAAGGDAGDRELFSPSLLSSGDAIPSLAGPLNALARKYSAPAVALVVLRGGREPVRADDELQLDVTYLERNAPDTESTQGTVFVSNALAQDPLAAAVGEAGRLIARVATGAQTGGQTGDGVASSAAASARSYGTTGTSPYGTPGLSASSRTVYDAPPEHVLRPPVGSAGVSSTPTAAVSPSTSSLWVRIPLSQPSDLAGYRRRIESIPGARFEISALNRAYVEGNIRYTGPRAALMRELAARGLAQSE